MKKSSKSAQGKQKAYAVWTTWRSMHFDVDSQSPNLIIKNILTIYKSPKAFESAQNKELVQTRERERAHTHTQTYRSKRHFEEER